MQKFNSVKFLLVNLCVCVLILSSCAKKEEKIPADIIPKEKMVQLLTEIHLADAKSQLKAQYDDNRNLKQSFYKFILSKYRISYNQLMNSFNYYAAHPELFSAIYEDVITELSKKQAEAEKNKETKSAAP